MRRAIVDQDITPRDRLRRQLPDDLAVTVGIEADEAAVVETVAGADVALVTSRVPMTRAVIRQSALDVIGKLGTGLDSVDCEAAADHGVTVTYTPGYNALSVAEQTVCLLLATARRLTEARRLVESGGWRDEFTLGSRVAGSTVGIVGFGNVGKRVGRLLSGFGVDLLAHDPYVPDVDAELVDATTTSLEDLLARSDAVVLTTELTAETRGLVGERELSRMSSSAILVNTARGPVVDESALIDAIRSGTIAGAGLDVFATEPLDPDSPLLALDSVVVTPHTAAVTTEARTATIDRLATNVRTLADGESLHDRFLATPT
jgi:phosphoglycerate dehydrogenase-like enzyme